MGYRPQLEDFNSLLKYNDDDFKPYGGNLSYWKENGDSVVKMMSPTPLEKLENLRWYIQHLINESGYLYDDEFNNALSEDKWVLQTHGEFMNYVFFSLHRMTPEQLKMYPIRPIFKIHPNQELDTVEGESTKDEEEFNTSTEFSEENSTSDIPTEATE